METETRRQPEIEIVIALGVLGWYGTVLVDGRAWQTTTAAETPAQAQAAADKWLRLKAIGNPDLARALRRRNTRESGQRPAFAPDDHTLEACRRCLNALADCTCKAVR